MKSITISAPDELFDQTVAAICGQYGYQAQVADPDHPGEQMSNPVTSESFAKAQLLRWLRENIEAYTVRQANAAVDAARSSIQATLDAAASSITSEIT